MTMGFIFCRGPHRFSDFGRFSSYKARTLGCVCVCVYVLQSDMLAAIYVSVSNTTLELIEANSISVDVQKKTE